MKLDARDLVFLAGLLLTAAGFGIIYLPLALIFPGLVLLYVALRGGER